MKSTYTTAINFIGDTGMFKVESGSFTKDYDEKTDRLVFTVNGEAALNTLSLTLAGMDVNSASYVLPITNNITINIQSANVTINQTAALLAGVEVNIAEGAGLTVANEKNIYFYDSDEWNSDNFVWGPCKFKSVAYAPGKAYNRSDNDLVDAKMDVNGSVTAIGAIYTTNGGADICSSNGTGKYVQQRILGKETATYCCIVGCQNDKRRVETSGGATGVGGTNPGMPQQRSLRKRMVPAARCYNNTPGKFLRHPSFFCGSSNPAK